MFLLNNLLNTPYPTVFELAMCASLENAMKPAYDFLLRTLAETYPSSFWFKLQTSASDEVFLLLRFLLERSYLKDYNACFAENFYGLKRVKYTPVSASNPYSNSTQNAIPNSTSRPLALSSSDKAMSLILTLFFPYIRRKLRDKYNAFTETESNSGSGGGENVGLDHGGRAGERGALGGNRMTFREALRRAFVRLWPLFEASYESLTLLFHLLFMFGRSKFYTPLFYIQGVYFSRLDTEDYKAQRDASEELEKNGSFLAKLSSRGFTAFRVLLISSALVFKLVEWYYSAENRAQREASQAKPTAMTSIPPPIPPQPLPSATMLAKDPEKCPICANKRTNPAIASSGLVFCYACIHDHVSVNGTCPVTGIKCSIQQIRRIYQA